MIQKCKKHSKLCSDYLKISIIKEKLKNSVENNKLKLNNKNQNKKNQKNNKNNQNNNHLNNMNNLNKQHK
jgi:hypothetical protein